MHGDSVGGDYPRWLRSHGIDPAKVVGRANGLAHDYKCPQAWRTAVPEEFYPTNFVAERTIEYLERRAPDDDDAPFFLMMSIPDPHHPFTPPGRYWDMYRPEDAVLDPSFHDVGNNSPPTLAWALAERVQNKVERENGQFLFVVDEREAREAIALTYGMMACVDDAVGKVLGRLGELGLDDDTVIAYTSDHGDFLGDYRLLIKEPLHFQSLITVPMLWRDPVGAHKGAATQAWCATVDLGPTILDRAGLNGYNGIQGRSFLGDADTLLDQGPGSILIEDDQQHQLLGFDRSPRVHALVSGQWTISIYDNTGWGELYDFGNDPLENHNRWFDEEAIGIKADLLEQFVRREIALVDRSPLLMARV
jgi:arylsulfatase